MADGSSSATRAINHPFFELFELRLGLAVWAALILGTCTYCLMYQAFVSAVHPDVARTITLALREWGVWALLAPWVVHTFRDSAVWHKTFLRCVCVGLLAASLPIAVDQLIGERSLGSSLALFWPRNAALAFGLFLIARVFSPPVVRPASAAVAALASTPIEPTEKPSALLVSKGADQCLIEVDDIQHLSAAGNYVDICARDQRYLMRATLSDLEATLPSEHFVRVHRSHIVRVSEIERIRIERSGSGVVHLRGGGTLAISKGYRAQLRRHQGAARQIVH
jgi:hypothetical protein